MLKLKLAVIALLMVLVGIGQQFHFKNYSLEEGLSRSGVYYILQDHAGFLWIGTDGGGVCKYDGQKFETYSRQDGLASEKVRIIFEDSNHTLWFGTDNGLSFLENDHFVSLTTEDGLSDNFVRSITQDHEGNLWVGTNKGISIIDPSEREVSDKLKLNFHLPHRKIRSLLADSTVMWIGTDAGLVKYDESKISVISKADGLTDSVILSLFIDKYKNLWVGTPKGLSKVDVDGIESWVSEDGLINGRVRTINEDIYHNIWIGTKDGVSIFDGNRFLNLTMENGLSNNRIRCIQTDNFDNIWLGTYFGGIMRFNYKHFIAFTPKEGLISNQISSIIEDNDGHIMIGSLDGVSRLKIKNNKLTGIDHVTTENGLISNTVQTIYKDDNANYWCGTDRGLTIIIGGEEAFNISAEDGLLDENITCVKQVGEIYYIGTKNGLAEISFTNIWEIKSLKFIKPEDGLAGREISFIEADQNGQIWIGFADGQLSILSNDQVINPVLDKSISEITSIVFDDLNHVWLGTNGRGLYFGQYDDAEKNLHIKKFTSSKNLTSNYIYSLLLHEDRIWVGHERGLDLIHIINDSTFKVQSFGLENGFLGLQNNQNASYIDLKGDLWFGTVNGLYQLKNKELNYLKEGKKTINYIQSVKVNGENIYWPKSEYAKGIEGYFNLPVELELPYDMNNISFDFIAINYVFPEKIKYAWKLQGYDQKWSELNPNNYCVYTNLDPGNYTFILRTTNERGELLDDLSTFEFIIHKPFWITWWFRIIVLILGCVGVLVFMNYRTKQLLNKQKVLEETITERTDEIVKQKDEIEKTKKEIENQYEELSFKNKEITDSITYSRRIQHSILPSSEKFDSVIEHYFIFYKPKDIVSGDFYWIEKHPSLPNQIYFAVADCTGHGVPGAMVSLISTRALNSALLEHHLLHPNKILDKTNDFVRDAFYDEETGNIINDGMDIAFGSLNYDNEEEIKFEFAGAQNPAWIVLKNEDPNLIVNGEELDPDLSNETHKLFVLKGNKQPIGHFDNHSLFDNHTCQLKKQDKIYLFSDGFADQFGGYNLPNTQVGGKKYKYKPLKKFLLNIQHLSIEQQKVELQNEFYKWKQDFEQVDDVCFMGVEV